MTPLDLIDVLSATGWHSLGLHIGAAEETEPWWAGGAGEHLLAATIDRLLETRITVLDVGRVVLDRRLERDDVHRAHGRVLDFGARLGAQFVTARFDDGAAAPGSPDEASARFARLAEQARPFRLRPLLSAVSADAPESFAGVIDVVAPCGGGVVLDVPVEGIDEDTVALAITDLWEHLGYARVDARALERVGEGAAGLLAVLPPHVPVVVGGGDSLGLIASDHSDRLRRLRLLVDRMLEHPRARALREAGAG